MVFLDVFFMVVKRTAYFMSHNTAAHHVELAEVGMEFLTFIEQVLCAV